MSALGDPGAAAVGRLLDLPPLEQRMIHCLRLWSDGAAGQAELGRELPERTVSTLDGLLGLLALARRPLRRHAVGCPCAGADECVLARMVALAAEGAREDAMLMAMLIVRPDIALGLARQAEALGLMLMRDHGERIIQ